MAGVPNPAIMVEKCPHFDPETRLERRRGKGCPEYNSPKGCPYAHPWETDKWDGDEPGSAPVVSLRRPSDASEATITRGGVGSGQSQGPLKVDSSNNRQERMDVDETRPAPSAKESPVLTRPSAATFSSQQPSDSTRISLHDILALKDDEKSSFIAMFETLPQLAPALRRRRAVWAFLSHIVALIDISSSRKSSETAFTDLKDAYKRYSSQLGADLCSNAQPGVRESWLLQRKERKAATEAVKRKKDRWIESLQSILETEVTIQTADTQLVPGVMDIAAMEHDHAAVTAPPVLGKSLARPLVEAFEDYRNEVEGLSTKENLTELQSLASELSKTLESRIPALRLKRPPEDMEMKLEESNTAPAPDSVAAADDSQELLTLDAAYQRLDDLYIQIQDFHEQLNAATDWGDAHIADNEDLHVAVKNVADEFAGKVAREAKSKTQQSEREGNIEEMDKFTKSLGEKEESIGLMAQINIDNDQTVVFPPEVTTSVQALKPAPSLSQGVESLLQGIEHRTKQYSSMDQAAVSLHVDSVLQAALERTGQSKMGDSYARSLPSLISQEAGASIPSAAQMQVEEMTRWKAEYEELRKVMNESIIGPIAHRTDMQEEALETAERERAMTHVQMHPWGDETVTNVDVY